MSLWRVIVDFLYGLLSWWRQRQDQAAANADAEKRRAEDSARETTERIREKTDGVEAPWVDSSAGSDDPGGFGGWNSRVPRR